MARSSRSSWWLSAVLLLAACAHGVGSERPTGDQATAKRIYMVAEERYAAGDFDEAVALMRHALLQLPASPEHDHLRHSLILRMAHTQLRASAASGQAAPLLDAQQMLTRYLERHEQLFGENVVARAERGEVYELLFLVEQQLDPVSIDMGDDATLEPTSADMIAEASAIAEPLAEDPAAAELPSAVPEPPPAELVAAAPEPGDQAPPLTSTRHVDETGSEVRDVVVHQGRLASLDDPRVMERLRSPYSTGWLGGALTNYSITRMRDARALVRGRSRLAGDGDLSQKQLARRAGYSLLAGTREQLRECYAAAYTRQPIAALESSVEASVHPDGSISHVRIVEGGLVDGYGDACVIEALQAATVAPLPEAAEPLRVQVALTFFYEGALYVNESTGEQFHEGQLMVDPTLPRLQGLPPIERRMWK